MALREGQDLLAGFWTSAPRRSSGLRSERARADGIHELHSLGLRGDAKLMLQGLAAALVLLERRRPLAGSGEKLHQQPISGFTERIGVLGHCFVQDAMLVPPRGDQLPPGPMIGEACRRGVGSTIAGVRRRGQ